MVLQIVKSFIAVALFYGVVSANQVEVSADSFYADEKAGLGELVGNVLIKKGKSDTLTANRVKIYFDKNRKPQKYEAISDAKFSILLDGKKYNGSGDLLTYEPKGQIYTLKGSAFLHEVDSDKKIFGDEIIVDQLKGVYSVKSKDKKPVKFIFQVEDK